jgi:hypothetical protein
MRLKAKSVLGLMNLIAAAGPGHAGPDSGLKLRQDAPICQLAGVVRRSGINGALRATQPRRSRFPGFQRLASGSRLGRGAALGFAALPGP